MNNVIIAIPMKDPQFAKTRLAGGLSADKRQQLAIVLFQKTVSFFRQNYPAIPLATVTASTTIAKMATDRGAHVIHEPRVNGLNNAAQLASYWAKNNHFDALFIIPADIPVLVKTEIDVLFDACDDYDVIIAESRNGGTNALLLSPPTCLPFHYGKNSATAHEKSAQDHSLNCHRLCLNHLSQDVDSLTDLLSLNNEVVLRELGI